MHCIIVTAGIGVGHWNVTLMNMSRSGGVRRQTVGKDLLQVPISQKATRPKYDHVHNHHQRLRPNLRTGSREEKIDALCMQNGVELETNTAQLLVCHTTESRAQTLV